MNQKDIELPFKGEEVLSKICKLLTKKGRKKLLDSVNIQRRKDGLPELIDKIERGKLRKAKVTHIPMLNTPEGNEVEVFEGYHLKEFANHIAPNISLPQDSPKPNRSKFEDLLGAGCETPNFKTIQNIPPSNGTSTDLTQRIFQALADVQEDIPLVECFVQFLEFCEENHRPIRGFNKKKLSRTIRHLRSYIDDYDFKGAEKNTRAKASEFQPTFAIREEIAGSDYYYANATLKVIGRDDEEKRLREFLDCEKDFAWFQLAGVAGQGKSRLAFDLINEVNESEEWQAGLLDEYEVSLAEGQWQEWQPNRPHLLVFDYVVGRETQIKTILQTLHSRSENLRHPVRLLLLERQRWNKGGYIEKQKQGNKEPFTVSVSDNNAQWFINLCTDGDYNGLSLAKSRFKDGVQELEKLKDDELVKVVRLVAEKDKALAKTITNKQIKKMLHHIDRLGRPLYAYFLGQELAHNPIGFDSWSTDEVLTRSLRRESLRRWKKKFGNANLPAFGDNHRAMKLAVLATIIREFKFDDSKIKERFDSIDSKARREALVFVDGPLTSDEKKPPIIKGLEPDLLGEWFVLHCFKEGLEYKQIFDLAWQYSPNETATFLHRVTQDFIEHPFVHILLAFEPSSQNDDQLRALSVVVPEILSTLVHNNQPMTTQMVMSLQYAAKLPKPDKTALNQLGYLFSSGIGVKQSDSKAAELFQQAADQGLGAATFNLGLCYENGDGVTQDHNKATELYQQAADQGFIGALFNLGLRYADGNGVTQDRSKAAKLFQKVADQGHSEAAINLGLCYASGNGVTQDHSKAAELFQKVADQGHSEAAINLGLCYSNGNGVTQDHSKAAELFQQAADQGHSNAAFNLGLCYADGIGVTKDHSKSAELFQKAADQGHSNAAFNLGVYYANGIGVTKDHSKSAELYQQAADQGHSDAAFNLGVYYANGTGVTQDHSKAAELFQQAADQGHIDAAFILGLYYANGTGVIQDHSKAAELFQKAADQGHSDAMVNLGVCYDNGTGATQDHSKAAELYQQAADQGYSDAMANLGVCYENGIGVTQDYRKSAELYQQAADQGHSDAMVNLGVCYKNGIGVTQDHGKATDLFQQAADQGNSDAIVNLGVCYENGIGVTRDHSKAVELFRQAADQGGSGAMVNLGLCYQNGIGVTQDHSKAAQLYQKAAGQGRSDAMVNLGIYYASGIGVTQDHSKAAELFQQAADQGLSDAACNLGLCYANGIGVTQDHSKATELFQQAADQGYSNAMLNLGLCYKNGTGVTQDHSKAAELYQQAADQGHSDAAFNLGLCYASGTGVTKDHSKAVELYQKAADQGHSDALFNLGVCYENGTGVNENLKKAAELYQQAVNTGHTNAMINLAVFYTNGTGVEKDLERVIALYQQAVDGGNVEAMFQLAVCYKLGLGVEKNKARAVGLYRQAFENGYSLRTYLIDFYRNLKTKFFLWSK